MKLIPQDGMGVVAAGFDPQSSDDIAAVRDAVYTHKIVLLPGLHPDPDALLTLGKALGEPEAYYEPIYHHPEVKEVFVSSSIGGDQRIGVPKTGKFWHSDYQFMARPFDITVTNPQAVPTTHRGTYFIDLTRAYQELPCELQHAADTSSVTHSVRRYFKIRPSDVYRPISEVIEEVDRKTPPVSAPAVRTHRRTGAPVLYISEGFTIDLTDADGRSRPDLLRELLDATGQLDTTFTHPAIHLQRFNAGDVLLWDNRSLVHRALHTTTDEPTVTHRVTVHDDREVAA